MSIEQEYYNTARVVLDGTATVLIDEFVTRAGEEGTKYIITIKKDTTVVLEVEVVADDIELVRL